MMKTFSVPTRDQVSLSNRALFDRLTKVLGMVPNLYAVVAHSENALSKYLAFQTAKTSLSNKEKEAVNLVVSEVNGCRYCQSAHSVLGKANGFSDNEILDLRAGMSGDTKLHALVELAKEITENRGRVTAAVIDKFYAAGYTEESLIDLLMQISDKIAMNYLHNLTQIRIDFPVAPELKHVSVL